MLTSIMPWTPLLACATSDIAAPAADAAWNWEPADTGTVAQDVGEMELAAQDWVDRARTVVATDALDVYHAAMSLGTGSCPEVAVTEGTFPTEYWDGMCSGPDGTIFKGPMTQFTWSALTVADAAGYELSAFIPDDGLAYDGVGMYGQTDIYTADGSVDYNCSCWAIQGSGRGGEAHAWFSLMSGPTHWTGEETADTWLADEALRATLWQYYAEDATGARTALVSGSLTGLDFRYDTVEANLSLVRDAAGACSALDLAWIEARDARTSTRATGDLDIAPDCTACAHMGDDEDLCVDLAPLFAWEGTPF
jgi:hypothetical protein